jgi:hypothetical protein
MEGRLLSSHPIADNKHASNPSYVQTYKCGIALSPDGGHMVTCTGLQTNANILPLSHKALKNSDGGRSVVQVGGHEANVSSVDWSNVAYKGLKYDGAVVSGGMDGSVVVSFLQRA